jgi:hypothetical protein
MRHNTLDDFIASGADVLRQAPIALIFVEDSVEANSTIKHHLGLGYGTVLVFAVVTSPSIPPMKRWCTALPMTRLNQRRFART